MFEHSRRLLVADFDQPGRVARIINDVRFELLEAPSAARTLLNGWKAGSAHACAFELEQFDQAVGQAMGCLDEVGTTDGRARFADAMTWADRWFDRAQSEASTVAGPTSLSLVNLVVRSFEDGSLLTPALLGRLVEHCEGLAAVLPPGEEKTLWLALSAAAGQGTLEPVLAASRQVEACRLKAAPWTSWDALNRVLWLACESPVGPGFQTAWRKLVAEFDAISRGVLKIPGSDILQAAQPVFREHFKRVGYWLQELEKAAGQPSVLSVVRRLSIALADLHEKQVEIEAALADEIAAGPAPPDPKATSSTVDTVYRAACDYANGTGSMDAFMDAIGTFSALLDEARQQVTQSPEGVDQSRYLQGLDSLYQAIASWSMLLSGNRDALQTGLEHAETGIERIVESVKLASS